MSMGQGPNRIRNRWPSRYETVGSGTVSTGDVSVDFSDIQDIAADYRSSGKRPMVHHFAVRVRVSATTAIELAAASILVENVLSVISVTTKTPHLNKFIAPNKETLTNVDLAGRHVNPTPYTLGLMSLLENGLSPFSPFTSPAGNISQTSYGGSVNVANGNADALTSFMPEWGTSNRVIPISTTVAGVDFVRDYFVMIPMCVFSGGNSIETDLLPLELFTDASAPLVVKFTDGNGTLKIANVLESGGVPLAGAAVELELSAFIVPKEDTDDYCFGVTWGIEATAIGTAAINLAPDFYRSVCVYPPIATAVQADGVASLAFQPFNFWTLASLPDADGSMFTWIDNSKIVFPGEKRNTIRKLIEGFNAGLNLGCNPALRWRRGVGNLFVGANSALGAATIVDDPFGGDVLGLMTNFPLFPVLFNHPAAKGMAPCFMGDPSDGQNANNLRINFTGFALSAAMTGAARQVVMAGSQKWRDDKTTIGLFEKYGQMNSSKSASLPSYQPLTGPSKTGKAGVFRAIVPWCAPA